MRNSIVTLLIGGSLALTTAGCGDGGTASDAGAADLSSVADMAAAPSVPDMGCYAKPTTYFELLNACTNAQAIDKTPVTPLLNKDGTLPPLP